MSKLQVAIVGATGFTGSELVRILCTHPQVEIHTITSESKKGAVYSQLNPQFKGICDLELISMAQLDWDSVDLIYLALPHRVSMSFVKDHHEKNIPIIDLSGDFRLNDAPTYEHWYQKEHEIPELVPSVAYGMPELHADQIGNSKIVANPGCFPTSSILPLAPLVAEDVIEMDSIIIDSKSGVTGAGAKSKAVNHFNTANENFKAYGLKKHRHTIEIEQQLNGLSDSEVRVQFTPHLLPLDRGILSTIYARPKDEISDEALYEIYRDYYQGAPFVRWSDQAPTVKQVRGSNYCDLYSTYDERTCNIISIAAIDNLVKGAAGQAVHNMNLMMGWPETQGLEQIPLQP